MSDYKKAYIDYKLSKAKEKLSDVEYLAKDGRWNACSTPLYYACFNAVSALFTHFDIITKTHSGVNNQFNLYFVKSGKVSEEYSKLLTALLDLRQKGEYEDMVSYDKETILPLIEPVRDFIQVIESLIQ